MSHSVQVTKLNAGDGIGCVSQNAWKQEDKTDHNKDNKRKYLCQMLLSATETVKDGCKCVEGQYF